MDSTLSISSVQGELLDIYQPNSNVFFSSPKKTLLALPPYAQLVSAGAGSIAQRAQESLLMAKQLGFSDPLIMGAIPFDSGAQHSAGALRVCSNVIRQPKLPFPIAAVQEKEVEPASCRVSLLPSEDDYKNSVTAALALFDNTELEKVVLSRALDAQFDQAPNVAGVMKQLMQVNPHAYVFGVNLNDIQPAANMGDRVLVGASPELLLSKTGSTVQLHPLAGSIPRSSDPVEDQQRATDLIASEKDLHEHKIVVDAIANALRPFCKTLSVPARPTCMSTATMWHLGTQIVGELVDENTSSIELALALHPTPAVGGYPVSASVKAIEKLENYPREYFTGLVGWCDSAGDGEWAITIRCAEVFNKRVRVYAGAGVVPGSCPEKECRETAAKFNTVLNAFGISPTAFSEPSTTELSKTEPNERPATSELEEVV